MDVSRNVINCEKASQRHHFASYNKVKFRFEWGCVTHPGIWACGGGVRESPPVLVGCGFQAPSSEPEFAWWCYIGPRPEFENEHDTSLPTYPAKFEAEGFKIGDEVRLRRNMTKKFHVRAVNPGGYGVFIQPDDGDCEYVYSDEIVLSNEPKEWWPLYDAGHEPQGTPA